MGTSPGGYDIHVLLPHPSLPQVLLLPMEDRWALPHWHTEERHFWQSVGHVNLDVWDRFGCDVTTLRCLGTASDAGRAVRWYELENHTAAPPAKSGEWLRPEALLDVADAGQRLLLGQWFREAVDGTPPRRRAWARRGWFAAARTWIDDQLRHQGLLRVGPVEQVRSWERGCVLRVPTMKGALYFKALPAMFGHEIPLIEALAASYPDAVVTPLAVDRDRHWMLMADMGDLSLDRVANPARWEEALGRFARLQLATAAAPDALIDLGCPDRRIEALPGHIDSFFAALPDYPGLSDEDVARLRALAPALKDDCVALARYRIPATLEHGDFWPGNVMVSDDAYIYFDWSDSHPFFSLTLFLEFDDTPHVLKVDPDLRLRLRDAYLAPLGGIWDVGRSYPSVRVGAEGGAATSCASLPSHDPAQHGGSLGDGEHGAVLPQNALALAIPPGQGHPFLPSLQSPDARRGSAWKTVSWRSCRQNGTRYPMHSSGKGQQT